MSVTLFGPCANAFSREMQYTLCLTDTVYVYAYACVFVACDCNISCIQHLLHAVLEQSERAFHLGLAALLAEKVYNFGEIVSHIVFLCPYIY